MPEQELFQKILGDVVANEEYGLVMRKWRELFNITQAEIAIELRVKPSVISDYESSRRKSPGIVFVRSYTLALLKLRKEESKKELKDQLKFAVSGEKLNVYNFKKPLKSTIFLKRLNALPVTKTHDLMINGSVVFFDNISKLLMKLPTYRLLKELKKGSEYCYVFMNVKTGKLPLIMLNILTKLNKAMMPTLIVFQSDQFKLSNFAKKTAEKKNITLAVTNKLPLDIKNIVKIF